MGVMVDVGVDELKLIEVDDVLRGSESVMELKWGWNETEGNKIMGDLDEAGIN